MPDFTKRVAKAIAGELHPGEAIVKALSAQPPGSLTRGINETGDTYRGMYRGRKEKQRHEAEAAGMAARIPPRNVFLTLTERRLLIHTMSKLGSPEELVADVPFDQIGRVDFEAKRFGSGSLDLVFIDDTGIDILIVQRQRPEEFVAAWEHLRP